MPESLYRSMSPEQRKGLWISSIVNSILGGVATGNPLLGMASGASSFSESTDDYRKQRYNDFLLKQIENSILASQENRNLAQQRFQFEQEKFNKTNQLAEEELGRSQEFGNIVGKLLTGYTDDEEARNAMIERASMLEPETMINLLKPKSTTTPSEKLYINQKTGARKYINIRNPEAEQDARSHGFVPYVAGQQGEKPETFNTWRDDYKSALRDLFAASSDTYADDPKARTQFGWALAQAKSRFLSGLDPFAAARKSYGEVTGNVQILDRETAKRYLDGAGGDKEKARRAAIRDGWTIPKVGK